jgi:hypothetical protein
MMNSILPELIDCLLECRVHSLMDLQIFLYNFLYSADEVAVLPLSSSLHRCVVAVDNLIG